eukprot:CAMPEP_0169469400 /NCGR_PEP_ID=MMETSP1042-20121227/23457_1 /TAXON_ID=464988 /ORGANISM="Hemiselmis andersenii, Strain CCMP1180" /LENGTH=35 /DNA_ID= /DNA_START= /DNA_END= /DNA_ORIENTATION=
MEEGMGGNEAREAPIELQQGTRYGFRDVSGIDIMQ